MHHQFLLILLFSISNIVCEISKGNKCRLRCIAKCYQSGKQLSNCESPNVCEKYSNEKICSNVDCWEKCLDLTATHEIPAILPSIEYVQSPSYDVNITWNGIDNAIYLIQFTKNNSFDNASEAIAESSLLIGRMQRSSQNKFCNQIQLRIATVLPTGISNFTSIYSIQRPKPRIKEALSVESLLYINETYDYGGYISNGTIQIIFSYVDTGWPLGDDDLIVEPVFHLVSCAVPDLSSAVPNPVFQKGKKHFTIEGNLTADMMYRKCQFLYYTDRARSKQCDTTFTNEDPDPRAMKTLQIDCDTVDNSSCADSSIHHSPPLCGQVDTFNYNVLNDYIDANYPETNITVKVNFRSTLSATKIPLYFIAFYGNALPYEREIDMDLLGVNITDILGNSTNCPNLLSNGTCSEETNLVNGSIVLTDIRMDTLYGVLICAVMDSMNLTFPQVSNVSIAMRPRANKMFIQSSDYRRSNSTKIIIIVSSTVIVIFFIIVTIFANIHRKQQEKMKFNKFKLEQLQMENKNRYTDLPKRQDIWELERRNLIIYDEKKLGSGAFGAVYMGKLIGIARAHKDAQSTLGINLMRVENCDVAVKMLPEYADQTSKTEFLNEIALMKTLGYHERLVNMLACITESEPYCLIVEYCSDGDLLQFLRSRCNYMLKLNNHSVNGTVESNETENDTKNMIITVKQLLMFAVQISYGLEYLSQKGFVHRDVAARNVLVHDNINAKIGDFGLCRYIYAKTSNYKGKGGRLPIKWMSLEAIKHYEFTTKSDVWSFGVLMFEIITLGGSPYPGIQPDDMMQYLDMGLRMEKPDNCQDIYYEVMKNCWNEDPSERPSFGDIRQKLAKQLEDITDEYSYLKLDSQRDYYNVNYAD